MSQITQIPNTPWRDGLVPASYRNATFHVEAGSREGGRRIVLHEFPKRNTPYAEDMGRKAVSFTVRAYCIAYPFNTTRVLYQRDYRIPRNILLDELEREGVGVLRLPLLPPMNVVVQQYRLTEEEKTGGYCVFDISFVEAGQAIKPEDDTRYKVIDASNDLIGRTVLVMDGKKLKEVVTSSGISGP
jgi:prophage DNA circulation protein